MSDNKKPIVLHGHTSFETAYVIEDYPFGFTLRCKKKIWIEEGVKGPGKGKFRVVSQTTNPKKQGEYWNAAKASTFADFRLLYLDPETGHVETDCFNGISHIAAFRDKWYDQLGDKQKEVVDKFYKAHLAYEEKYGPKKKAPDLVEEELDPFEGYDMPTL